MTEASRGEGNRGEEESEDSGASMLRVRLAFTGCARTPNFILLRRGGSGQPSVSASQPAGARRDAMRDVENLCFMA